MLWDSRWTFSISRDSAECLFPRICLVALWDSIEPTLRKFSSLNREILKPILPTTARKPASIQEHESYFCSLWDDSVLKSVGEGLSTTPNCFVSKVLNPSSETAWASRLQLL